MKAVNITLPTLPHHIEKKWTSMWGLGEMGSGCVQWRDLLVETVTKRCNQWLLASPFLERLHLNPPEEQEHKGAMFNSKNLQGRIDSG